MSKSVPLEKIEQVIQWKLETYQEWYDRKIILSLKTLFFQSLMNAAYMQKKPLPPRRQYHEHSTNNRRKRHFLM